MTENLVSQSSDEEMMQKNDVISRLEEKTNQITATMKQLEQRWGTLPVTLPVRLNTLEKNHFPRVASRSSQQGKTFKLQVFLFVWRPWGTPF